MRSGFGVHKMHHFVLPKLRLVFLQQTCPILFFRPKTKFLGGFVRFRCLEVSVMRTGFGCIQCTTLCFRSCVLFFCNKLAQSTSLGPKLSFWVVSHNSVGWRNRYENGFWGAYNAPLYASEVASCFFATSMPNPLL